VSRVLSFLRFTMSWGLRFQDATFGHNVGCSCWREDLNNSMFARCAQIRSQVLNADAATHLVVFTRSAHPGLLVAAREKGMQVTCYQDVESHHSRNHGQQLPQPQRCV
jgi:hypothetical protein